VTDRARIFRTCLAHLGIDEGQLLARMGIRDTAAGWRRLWQLVRDPQQKDFFAREVIAALGPVGPWFEVALDLALEEKQTERKAASPGFRPRLRILTVPPLGRSMGGTMLANLVFSTDLPREWAELPLGEGMERVVAVFAAWRHCHPKGCVPGFVWCRRPGEYWEFDEAGTPVARYEFFPIMEPDVLPGGRRLGALSRKEREDVFARYGVATCCRLRRRHSQEADGTPV
jgi:hypothetical protein